MPYIWYLVHVHTRTGAEAGFEPRPLFLFLHFPLPLILGIPVKQLQKSLFPSLPSFPSHPTSHVPQRALCSISRAIFHSVFCSFPCSLVHSFVHPAGEARPMWCVQLTPRASSGGAWSPSTRAMCPGTRHCVHTVRTLVILSLFLLATAWSTEVCNHLQ